MAEHASDYHPGDMDIHEQVHTYRLFGKLAKWVSLISAVSILFLSLWFCTNTGFLGSLVVAVVVAAIGVLVLRERKVAAH